MKFEELHVIALGLATNNEESEPLPLCSIPQADVDRLSSATDIELLLSSVLQSGSCPTEYSPRVHQNVLWLEACLRNPKGLKNGSSAETIHKLLEWLSRVLMPCLDHMQSSDLQRTTYKGSQLMATAALRVLAHLDFLSRKAGMLPSVELVFLVAMFTEASNPWTYQSTDKEAQDILRGCFEKCDPGIKQSLISLLLREKIVQLASINQCGTSRLAGKTIPQPSQGRPTDKNSEGATSKMIRATVTTVLNWCIGNLDDQGFRSNMNLIAPILLSWIDEGAINWKIKGFQSLRILVGCAPATLIRPTGLNEVLAEAILPSLSLVPPLCSEQDAIELHNAAHATLIQLAKVPSPDNQPGFVDVSLLDRLIRLGVINGLTYGRDHVLLKKTLMDIGRSIVRELGIYTVKHLHEIVPIVTDTLCTPFKREDNLHILSTIWCLQEIILTSWPRIDVYAGELLKGLIICFRRAISCDIEYEMRTKIERLLRETLRLLKAALYQKPGVLASIERVLQVEPRFQTELNPT